MSKCILITGGTGFIGRALIDALRMDNHELILISRYPEKVHIPGVKAYANVMALKQAKLDVALDAVINLAGAPIAAKRWSAKRRQILLDSRIGTTANLLGELEILESQPSVWINASAIGFYGSGGETILRESSPQGKGFAAKLCADWEAVIDPLNTRVCKIRIGVVLGNGGALKQLLPLYKMGLGGAIGRGTQWFSWIHWQDIVNLIVTCVFNEKYSGIFNGVSPEPLRQKDFAHTLGRILHRPTFIPTPALALKLAYGQMAKELLLSSQRVVPERSLANGFEYRFPQLGKALENILSV